MGPLPHGTLCPNYCFPYFGCCFRCYVVFIVKAIYTFKMFNNINKTNYNGTLRH